MFRNSRLVFVRQVAVERNGGVVLVVRIQAVGYLRSGGALQMTKEPGAMKSTFRRRSKAQRAFFNRLFASFALGAARRGVLDDVSQPVRSERNTASFFLVGGRRHDDARMSNEENNTTGDE